MKLLAIACVLAFGLSSAQAAVDTPTADDVSVTLEDAKPVNAKCPMNPAKDVNPKMTVTYKEQLIGFCCGGCKARFEKLTDEEKAKRVAAVVPKKD